MKWKMQELMEASDVIALMPKERRERIEARGAELLTKINKRMPIAAAAKKATTEMTASPE